MLTRKVFKMKESRLITIPADICNMLGIEAGDRLGVDVENRKIILTPAEPTKAHAGAASTTS